MQAVWLRVRSGMRAGWQGPVALALITALAGGLVVASVAGARRTQTAVSRFLRYAGSDQGQVSGSPAVLNAIAALPGVAYTDRGALLLAAPFTAGGALAAAPGQVLPYAMIRTPPQEHVIVVAGRLAVPGRVGQAMLNETAARVLRAGLGSVIRLRGFRPAQAQRVLNGAQLAPTVRLPPVRVTGIIRRPSDLGSSGLPADVIYTGTGTIYLTAAFYQRYGRRVAGFGGLGFRLRRGAAGLPAFAAAVHRLSGGRAELQVGSDDETAAAAAERATSVQAFALLLFGLIMALALLAVVSQSITRLIYGWCADFPALRALGAGPGQLFAIALSPALVVAAVGMAGALAVAYGLSAFTPIGLARQAEVSPGPAFNAAIVLGGAAVLALLLAGPAALTAGRLARAGPGGAARGVPALGAAVATRMARGGFPPAACCGVGLTFGPARARSAVPVRSAVAGMAAALAAVTAALVFGSSLAHVVADPVLAGWNWDVTVGNPHSGDISAELAPRLRADPGVAALTATGLGDVVTGGQHVGVVGLRPVTGQVSVPVLAGRLPRGPAEIALAGRELRALRTRIGATITARGRHGPVRLRVTGQVVVSPEITNEQLALGSGGVMTLAGVTAVSDTPVPANLFLVRLRRPGDQRVVALLRRQFPGQVLGPVPPPEIRQLQGAGSLPLALAVALSLLALGTAAHTLLTSVRLRRRDLAILKTIGFASRQVRAAVAWQATAIAAASLVIGLPLGVAAGRIGWTLFAGRFAIVPAPAVSPLLLLALPAVLVLANLIAAWPARSAARTRPAAVLRSP